LDLDGNHEIDMDIFKIDGPGAIAIFVDKSAKSAKYLNSKYFNGSEFSHSERFMRDHLSFLIIVKKIKE